MAFKMSVEPLDDDDDTRETLPPDVITEILVRLPPKSLVRLQLVSKEWQCTIFAHHFAEKYENHTDIGFFCRYFEEHDFDLNEPAPPELEDFDLNEPPPGSLYHLSRYGAFEKLCDGYGRLLMFSRGDNKYCLWNPAIHKLLDLPNPHLASDLFALSYLPATRSYKMLSFYSDEKSGSGFEIFTVGHSNAWRRLTSLTDVSQQVSGVTKKQPMLVSTGQDIHCVRDLVIGNENFGEIITFDMANESFAVTSLPIPFLAWSWVLNWDGKLGFAGTSAAYMHVMVLDDYRKQKWSEIKFPLPFLKKGINEPSSLFPLFYKNGEVLFVVKDGNKILSYSPETGMVQDVLKLRDDAVLDDLCPYKPSLVSFEGMQPDTKVEPYRYSEGLTN